MAKVKRKAKKKNRDKAPEYEIKLARRVPVNDPWRYTYVILGEKKIGKTTFAIEDSEEFVLQFDRPQLSQSIREEHIEDFTKLTAVVDALEKLAEEEGEDFPFNRIVIDGVGGMWQCVTDACLKHFRIKHPSEEEWGAGWHWIRDRFTELVDRLNMFKVNHGCGVLYIAHSEWKEVRKRGAPSVEKLKAELPPKCESILEGKADMWALYDYSGPERILVIQGDESVSAGHSIDGHFLTPAGDKVREIPMGNSPEEALANFLTAFNNKQGFPDLRSRDESKGKRRAKKKRRKG